MGFFIPKNAKDTVGWAEVPIFIVSLAGFSESLEGISDKQNRKVQKLMPEHEKKCCDIVFCLFAFFSWWEKER